MRQPGFMVLLCVLLSGCGEKAIVHGTVKDNFGHPIAGVTVSIANSAFTASTDSSGDYEIAYVPGNFSVEFAKTGYAEIQVPLNISEKADYPMREVTLTKLPPSGGVFLQGTNNYVPLAVARVASRSASSGFMSQQYTYYLDEDQQFASANEILNKEIEKLPDAELTIFDTYPQPLAGVSIQNGNDIGSIESGPMSNRSGVKFDMRKPTQVGSATVRTIPLRAKAALTGGVYCLVQVGRTFSGNVLIVNKSNSFCLGGVGGD